MSSSSNMTRRVAAVVFAVGVAGLAGKSAAQPLEAALSEGPTSWQCAQFARLFSGIEIFGDAWTWWDQALGRYDRGADPKAGSVLVFKSSRGMARGHVAVVNQVLTDRIIQVTHANWSPVEGKRGQIENNVTVVDVSPAGDWSSVKVWYKPSGDLGVSVYPTYGFVYKASDEELAAKASTGPSYNSATRAALSAEVAEALR